MFYLFIFYSSIILGYFLFELFVFSPSTYVLLFLELSFDTETLYSLCSNDSQCSASYSIIPGTRLENDVESW